MSLRESETPVPDAHSHVGVLNYEYIVFHPAQILPCYVIHLDLGAEAARKALEKVPANPFAWLQNQKRKPKIHPKLCQNKPSPGDKLREKQAKQAAAAKWFPYGYGPAQGTSFVIEEIGEVSEDEENYGDYQAARLVFDKGETTKVDFWGGEQSIFDEYTLAKKMHVKGNHKD